jgi:5-methylthioadenosine/S-adenosylhomocysteine deaminase
LSQDSAAEILIFPISILPSFQSFSYIPVGWIAINENRISGMGSGPPPSAGCRQRIAGDGCLAMPGLINGHTHAPMSLFRGLADDLPLKTWLEEHMFPAEAKWVNAEFAYQGTLLACAEMIRSGTTTFADGYFFEEQAAKAVHEAGMRAILAQGTLDFPTPDSPGPQEGLKRIGEFVRTHSPSSLVRPSLFAHALYTYSPALLVRCRDLAEEYGVPWVIHLAETQSEVEEVSRKYGRRPVDHMESLGLLSPNLIACHCVWLTEGEMDLLARRGVKVVHNPESNMKLASGVAPVPDLLRRGIAVGLGTDGCASNNNLDLFQEMDFAAKVHKVHRMDPTVMPAETVLEMATLGGARVLGLEDEIGTLTVGKKADLIVVDLEKPHLQPVYNVVSQLVYAAGGADVRDVIIDGRIVMKDRKLLTLNEEKILAQARIWRERIIKKV